MHVFKLCKVNLKASAMALPQSLSPWYIMHPFPTKKLNVPSDDDKRKNLKKKKIDTEHLTH